MSTIVSTILWCAVCIPQYTHAYEAHFIAPAQHDITSVTDIESSQAFYGELRESPQLFAFTIVEPTSFFAEILVPDTDVATNDKSGLLLKVDAQGVSEVVRMPAKGASWESFYEWVGGDWYRRGPTYFDSLEPGVYQLEVSTPTNVGKYVLVVGKEQSFPTSYTATVRDLHKVKLFFNKSSFALVQSPLLYVPLLAGVGCIYLSYISVRRMRRKQI
jgi:hypothetical protein